MHRSLIGAAFPPSTPRLNFQGYPLGLRLLDLLLYREPGRSQVRPTRILPLLQFIHSTLWPHLFGRRADSLERSSSSASEYMIADNEPLVSQYVSVPKEMSQLNVAAFVAGIVEGVCDGAAFPAKVTAVNNASELWSGRTVFLVKFTDEVIERRKCSAREAELFIRVAERCPVLGNWHFLGKRRSGRLK